MSNEILSSIFSKQPEQELFHYTTMEGLLGIIRKKEIWASHTQYLNDQKEFLHANSLLRAVISDFRSKCTSSLENRVLDEMNIETEGNESINVCVCSFSEEEDSLSQWRAYTNSSAGFSIGFGGQFIKNIADVKGYYLVPCLYNEEEQVSLLSTLVEKVLNENITLKDEIGLGKFPTAGELSAQMNRYAPIIKDVAFKDEREWRIITEPLSCKSECYDFRTGTSMLVPYTKISLTDENGNFIPSSITIGPTPNLKQSKMSLSSFLVKNHLKNINVIETKVPYRSW